MSSSTPPQEPLFFPPSNRSPLQPYLPQNKNTSTHLLSSSQTPHLTLTYAQSLDGMISLSPTQQTALSSPFSKAMTHYLRSKHDAILIGSATACTDDPSLNCRFAESIEEGIVGLERQPRPVVVDFARRWRPGGSRVCRVAREGLGRGVWWVVGRKGGGEVRGENEDEDEKAVREAGGEVIIIDSDSITEPTPPSPNPSSPQNPTPPKQPRFIKWEAILQALAIRGIKSVMVEGGAKIINGLYREENRRFVSSVVVTVAPKYLGEGGVVVCPGRREEGRVAVELVDVVWFALGRDGVMAARVRDGDGDEDGS